MKCNQAETLLFRAFDGMLTEQETKALVQHLAECPACRRLREDYASILEVLSGEAFPQEKPYFWERLKPRLHEGRTEVPWNVWKRWSILAVPLSIVAVLVLGLAVSFLMPQPEVELSSTGALLLRESPPLPEPLNLLEEGGSENRNMRIIFTAMEEKQDTRRYFP